MAGRAWRRRRAGSREVLARWVVAEVRRPTRHADRPVRPRQSRGRRHGRAQHGEAVGGGRVAAARGARGVAAVLSRRRARPLARAGLPRIGDQVFDAGPVAAAVDARSAEGCRARCRRTPWWPCSPDPCPAGSGVGRAGVGAHPARGGVALALRARNGTATRCAGVAVAVWSPYVAERLLHRPLVAAARGRDAVGARRRGRRTAGQARSAPVWELLTALACSPPPAGCVVWSAPRCCSGRRPSRAVVVLVALGGLVLPAAVARAVRSTWPPPRRGAPTFARCAPRGRGALLTARWAPVAVERRRRARQPAAARPLATLRSSWCSLSRRRAVVEVLGRLWRSPRRGLGRRLGGGCCSGRGRLTGAGRRAGWSGDCLAAASCATAEVAGPVAGAAGRRVGSAPAGSRGLVAGRARRQ